MSGNLLVLLLTVAGTLSGCTDDGQKPGGTSRTTTSTSETPPTTQATVAPATGRLVEQNALHFRLFDSPHDWGVDSLGSAFVAGVRSEYGSFDIAASDLRSTPFTTDEGAATALTTRSKVVPRLTRAEDRSIDGVDCYVLIGANAERRRYLVGGYHGGYQFLLEFDVPADEPGTQDKIEAVLASIEWQ